MSCNNPITPKRFYFFFYYYFFDFLALLYSILYSLPRQRPSLYVCPRSQTVSQSFLFPTSGLGGFLFSILCSLFYPVPGGTGFSDSHLIPWSMVKDCFNASFFLPLSWVWFWGLAIINMCVYFILDSPSIVWIIGLCTTGGFLVFIIPQFQY